VLDGALAFPQATTASQFLSAGETSYLAFLVFSCSWFPIIGK
jgi:hypothetical protein